MASNLFVTNNSDDHIEVAINLWEKGSQSPNYYTIKKGDGYTQDWNRNDSRGFIMAVKRGQSVTETYYVFGDRDYRIKNDGVYNETCKLTNLRELPCAVAVLIGKGAFQNVKLFTAAMGMR